MWGLLLALQAVAPAVTPPPPPMPIVDCFVPGPFIVFFDRNSAALGAEARSILTHFVQVEADPCGVFRFGITGHADRGERAGVDRRRVKAVRAFLTARGLRRLVAATRGVGNTVPRVVRAAGVDELQNRRVELHAMPGG